MKQLRIIKIGGNVLDNQAELKAFLDAFSSLSGINILVHGGGKIATAIGKRMGISENLLDGRRITDSETLDLVVMVYAGLVNKKIVASLQALNCNAIGLTGADGNILPATMRPVEKVNYGFVGDIDVSRLKAERLMPLIESGYQLVIAPITHDQEGQLLNTNADTIASSLAGMLTKNYEVELFYCFEKRGVLDSKGAVINNLNKEEYLELKRSGVISAGMIPKLDNAFASIEQGVSRVCIINAADLKNLFQGEKHGTVIGSIKNNQINTA